MNPNNPINLRGAMLTSVLIIYAITLVVIAFLFSGCRKSGSDSSMSVYMTDAPGPFINVYVDVKEFRVHYTNSNIGMDGWVTLQTRAQVYDLLTLQNDVSVLIADNNNLQEGQINQLRLVLGANNYVVTTDSIPYPLIIPSSAESGLKINTQIDIKPGTSSTLTIDFDAAASIRDYIDGAYMMNPVIKVKSYRN